MKTCKLCLKKKALILKSHIIPEFMYKYSGLYDEKHRMRYSSFEDLDMEKQPSLTQSGEYESDILCSECDNNLIGINLEGYAKKVIYGGVKLPVSECPECIDYVDKKGNNFSICININYRKFKLFLLSILWRASISAKPFFNGINLGEHEEPLRRMLLNNDPKRFNNYPVFVITTAKDEEFDDNFIIEPKQILATDGIATCYFIIGGFIYIFKLGIIKNNLEELKLQTITEENKIAIPHLQNGNTKKIIVEYLTL